MSNEFYFRSKLDGAQTFVVLKSVSRIEDIVLLLSFFQAFNYLSPSPAYYDFVISIRLPVV